MIRVYHLISICISIQTLGEQITHVIVKLITCYYVSSNIIAEIQ